MKKVITTLTLIIAVSAFVCAQSTTATSDAAKATPTVNAADHMQKSDASECTPEMMKECKTDAAGTKSCCSSASASSTNKAGSTLSKEGDKAKSVSFGMSAKKPEKDE